VATRHKQFLNKQSFWARGSMRGRCWFWETYGHNYKKKY